THGSSLVTAEHEMENEMASVQCPFIFKDELTHLPSLRTFHCFRLRTLFQVEALKLALGVEHRGPDLVGPLVLPRAEGNLRSHAQVEVANTLDRFHKLFARQFRTGSFQ